MDRRASFWTDSTKSDCGVFSLLAAGGGGDDEDDDDDGDCALVVVVDDDGNGFVYAGSRERHRENEGEGNTVSALARMLVTVSG